MENALQQKAWEKILENYSSYEGTLNDFCSENNITKHQLYYYKKKLNKPNKPVFHAIALKSVKNADNTKKAYKDIRIEIGKSKIFISSDEAELLKTILKELAAIC
ncbi:hypothetical protein M2651_12585 [Clostridium sp. SYSU_GA19001]|uniref:IS66 family insertion sequence element accessory protein TnpA n=1 Tax=Clostridium caldaquaticum TaxID=2940653 RepID=UPI002077364B|nr:hypothetical protein [Clostridium caldaquaticum]MCM8711849.1 hypothetical protein [Clostridium caldaquaticum]